MDNRFTDIIQLIKQSRTNAIKVVNAELINLYWNIGEHVSKKIEQSEWGRLCGNRIGQFHTDTRTRNKRLLRQKYLENDAVLSDLQGLSKTLNTVETN